MTERPAFLAELDRLATDAQQEEVRFRRSFSEEVERRERARAFAFRRAGFLARVSERCGAAQDAEALDQVVRGAFAAEFGWHGDTEARKAVLDRFAPVVSAMSAVQAGEEADPIAEMATFEAWYAETQGGEFLALFDQEPFDAPLVEF